MIARFNTHVCLVSEQSVPNLVPLLASEFRPKKVIWLVTEKMQTKATILKTIAKKYQIESEDYPVDAYDMKKLQEQILNLLVSEDSEGTALNVTGGTKLMAIVAQDAFRLAGKPIFYFNIDTNEVQFLENPYSSISLQTQLKLEDYLLSYGYSVAGKLCRQLQISQRRKELTDTLIKDVRMFASTIGRINFLANMATSRDENRKTTDRKICLEIQVGHDDLHDPNWNKVVDLFGDADVLTVSKDKLRFHDVDARAYANGGWLEDHVFSIVKNCNFQDAALNVEVENSYGMGHALNELDVLFLAKNRLHMIECKSRNFADNTHGTHALYKLDSLAALGGLNTRCMLVSYRELRPADRNRAKDLNIKIVEADQLMGLKNQVQTWISR